MEIKHNFIDFLDLLKIVNLKICWECRNFIFCSKKLKHSSFKSQLIQMEQFLSKMVHYVCLDIAVCSSLYKFIIPNRLYVSGFIIQFNKKYYREN